jgi:hypothetical protein
MYYIISLKHTSRHDKSICLWQWKNSGYCSSKELAGVYEDYERGYHDMEGDSMPVKKENLDGLFMDSLYDSKGTIKKCIPNCKQAWEVLGVKMTKKGLSLV